MMSVERDYEFELSFKAALWAGSEEYGEEVKLKIPITVTVEEGVPVSILGSEIAVSYIKTLSAFGGVSIYPKDWVDCVKKND